MKNCEFYKNKTIADAQAECKKQGFKSLDKFLAAEHVWKPKYAVGDVVRTTELSDAETIVKIDYEHDGYVCVGLGYIVDTLLPEFISEGRLVREQVDPDVGTLPESDTGEKVATFECKALLDEIAKHLKETVR